jgi:hypothetical protein
MKQLFYAIGLAAGTTALSLPAVASGASPTTHAMSPKEDKLIHRAEQQAQQQAAMTFKQLGATRWNIATQWKKALDYSLLPIFLLRELGAKNPFMLCRTLDYDNSAFRRPIITGPVGVAARLRRALEPARLGAGRVCRFEVLAGNLEPVGFQYPVLFDWRGIVGAHGGSARMSWFEPTLGSFWLGYTAPEGFTGLTWGTTGGSMWMQDFARGNSVLSFKYTTGGPIMGGMGNVDQALDLWPVITFPLLFKPAARFAASADQPTLFGPEDWGAGTARWERFNFQHGKLNSVYITQPEIHLHDPIGNPRIITAGSGPEVQQVKFQPFVRLPYLRGGRTVKIYFSPRTDSEGVLPASMTIKAGTNTMFVGRFLSLRYFHGRVPIGSPWQAPRAAGFREAWRRNGTLHMMPGEQTNTHPKYYNSKQLQLTVPPSVLRMRIRYNSYAAAYTGNWPELTKTLAAYRQLLRAEHIPYTYYLFSLESLTEIIRKFVGATEGQTCTMAESFLLPAYERLSPRTAALQVARLVDQYQYGFALVALRAIRESPSASAQLDNWATRTTVELTVLIDRIRAHPSAYKRYALVNLLYPWKEYTKTSVALVGRFGANAADIKGSILVKTTQEGRSP